MFPNHFSLIWREKKQTRIDTQLYFTSFRMPMSSAVPASGLVTLVWPRCNFAPFSLMRALRPQSQSVWSLWCWEPNRYPHASAHVHTTHLSYKTFKAFIRLF